MKIIISAHKSTYHILINHEYINTKEPISIIVIFLMVIHYVLVAFLIFRIFFNLFFEKLKIRYIMKQSYENNIEELKLEMQEKKISEEYKNKVMELIKKQEHSKLDNEIKKLRIILNIYRVKNFYRKVEELYNTYTNSIIRN